MRKPERLEKPLISVRETGTAVQEGLEVLEFRDEFVKICRLHGGGVTRIGEAFARMPNAHRIRRVFVFIETDGHAKFGRDS